MDDSYDEKAERLKASLKQSEFVRLLYSTSPSPSDAFLRRLVYEYCKKYQDIYWFNQLESTFEYLELLFNDKDFNPKEWAEDFSKINAEVEDAMGEYFISLNELATAIHRLLSKDKMLIHEAIDAIEHVWSAHACNESLKDFVTREDQVLCDLLKSNHRGI